MPRGKDRSAVVAAVVSAVLGAASAAMSAYWAVGGTALLDTVGGEIEQWGRRRSAGVVVALVAIVVVKLIASAAPLVYAGFGPRLLDEWGSRRWARILGWIAAVVLALYGSVLTAGGLLVEFGVIEASGDADGRALAWHAYFWDPWFALWGIAFAVTMWRTRPTPRPT